MSAWIKIQAFKVGRAYGTLDSSENNAYRMPDDSLFNPFSPSPKSFKAAAEDGTKGLQAISLMPIKNVT